MVSVLAIMSAWSLGRFLQLLPEGSPWWLDTPAVLGFFGAYWSLYDRRGWRWRPFGMPLSRVPDLNGDWKGVVSSSHKLEEDLPATLTIRQTHSRIVAELRTLDSQSTSLMAAVGQTPSGRVYLNYSYINQPRALVPVGMHVHRGIVGLEMDGSGVLEGDYSTDWHRNNHGRLRFTRE